MINYEKIFKKAFTLIELVVVIAVIAILSAVSVVTYIGVTENAEKAAFEADAKTLYDEYVANQILEGNQDDLAAIYTNGERYQYFDRGGNPYYLGNYDFKTQTFDESNRFVLDFDNDGGLIGIDLNSTIEGIENIELSHFYYNSTDCLKNIRVGYDSTYSQINILGEVPSPFYIGHKDAYSPYLAFRLNSSNNFIVETKYKDFSKSSNSFKLNDDYKEIITKLVPDYTQTFVIGNDTEIRFPETFVSYKNERQEIKVEEIMGTGNFFADNKGGYLKDNLFYKTKKIIIGKIDKFNNYLAFFFDNDKDIRLKFESLNEFIFESENLEGNLANLSFATVSRDDPIGFKITIPNNYCPLFDKLTENQYGASKYLDYLVSVKKGNLDELLNNEETGFIDIYKPYVGNHAKEEDTEYELTNISTIKDGKTLSVPLEYGGDFKKVGGTTNNDLVINEENSTLVIKLTEDLVLEGNLEIGAQLSRDGTLLQGNISGKYASLDLNGHNLTIKKNGALKAAGRVFNSSNTKSKIIVENGGSLYTPFVLRDFGGGRNTTGKFNANNSPFNDYLMPYLEVETEFNYGSSLRGYCSMYASSSQHEIIMTFIGANDNSLIRIEENGKITLKKSDSLNDLANYKEIIDINGNVSINSLKFKFLADIDIGKVPFPISQFLEINIKKDANVKINQLLKVLKGASIIQEAGSTITFNDTSGKGILQSGIFVYDEWKTSSIDYSKIYQDAGYQEGTGHTNTNSGILNFYKNVINNGSIKLDGTLNFEGTNHIFNGKFDSLSIINSLDKYKDKLLIGENVLYETGAYNKDDGDWASGGISDAAGVLQYYLTPLIVGSDAYIKVDNNTIKGTFDSKTGVFESNGKTYIFVHDNETYEFGRDMALSSGKLVFDHNTKGSFKEATSNNNGTYKVGEKDYLYFMGTFSEAHKKNDETIYIQNTHFLYNADKIDIVKEVPLTYKDDVWKQQQ